MLNYAAKPDRVASRNYFEVGCACIASGVFARLDSSVSDTAAVRWYEQACKCSRNYVENGPRYSDELDSAEVAEIFAKTDATNPE